MHTQSMPCPVIAQARLGLAVLALPETPSYSYYVAANSATGFSRPNISRRTSAIVSKVGAFFVPAISLYGGCAWGAFGRAGFLESRSTNPRTAATQIRLVAISGGSSTLGAVPVKHPHALNPSSIQQHAASLKARAFAALHADSSLSVRLARYNAAMAKARALETVGGVPCAAL